MIMILSKKWPIIWRPKGLKLSVSEIIPLWWSRWKRLRHCSSRFTQVVIFAYVIANVLNMSLYYKLGPVVPSERSSKALSLSPSTSYPSCNKFSIYIWRNKSKHKSILPKILRSTRHSKPRSKADLFAYWALLKEWGLLEILRFSYSSLDYSVQELHYTINQVSSVSTVNC